MSISLVFQSSSKQMLDVNVKSGRSSTLLCNSLCTVHGVVRMYAVKVTESIVKQAMEKRMQINLARVCLFGRRPEQHN
jgi:hypothetical protein